MVRPLPGMSPYLASFIVPLRFNKLDLRDYLWHAYGVPVLKVRSFVNPRPLTSSGTHQGASIIRPSGQKMMIVELESPFVWPERVKGEDLPEEYDWQRNKRLEDADHEQMTERLMRRRGEIPMLTAKDEADLRGRTALREEAERLLRGEKSWGNEVVLDERWKALSGLDGKKRK